MERNSTVVKNVLSVAHFAVCNPVNPWSGQLSEPGPCDCKNLKLELFWLHGELL